MVRPGKLDYLFLVHKKNWIPMQTEGHYSFMKGNAPIQAFYCYKGELKLYLLIVSEVQQM